MLAIKSSLVGRDHETKTLTAAIARLEVGTGGCNVLTHWGWALPADVNQYRQIDLIAGHFEEVARERRVVIDDAHWTDELSKPCAGSCRGSRHRRSSACWPVLRCRPRRAGGESQPCAAGSTPTRRSQLLLGLAESYKCAGHNSEVVPLTDRGLRCPRHRPRRPGGRPRRRWHGGRSGDDRGCWLTVRPMACRPRCST